MSAGASMSGIGDSSDQGGPPQFGFDGAAAGGPPAGFTGGGAGSGG